ncbi:hypothetical protein ACXYTP_23920 [Tsukamurella ocularis]
MTTPIPAAVVAETEDAEAFLSDVRDRILWALKVHSGEGGWRKANARELARYLTEAVEKACAPAAPAPLDPGNPERFRQAAESAREMAKSPHLATTTWEHVAATFESQADRLDRERAEAAQDAADRKRANEIVSALTGPANLRECPTAEHATVMFEAALAGLRAGRARQGAGQ